MPLRAIGGVSITRLRQRVWSVISISSLGVGSLAFLFGNLVLMGPEWPSERRWRIYMWVIVFSLICKAVACIVAAVRGFLNPR